VISRSDIRAAHDRIQPYVRRTPVIALEQGAFGIEGSLCFKSRLMKHMSGFGPGNRTLCLGKHGSNERPNVLSLCTQFGGLMQATKVGIREFRENLADYLESKTPVAITRHGATIGIYLPTRPKPSQADLEALRVAGEKMQELIAAAGTSDDEIVEDFKRLRRERRTRSSS
jgi:hypothetical protein